MQCQKKGDCFVSEACKEGSMWACCGKDEGEGLKEECQEMGDEEWIV